MKPTLPFCLVAALLCSLPAMGADAKKSKTGVPPAPAKAPAAPAEEPAAPPAKPLVLPEVVATVNGQEIKKAELEKAFKSMLSQQGVSADAVPEGQQVQAYRMILDELVTDKILAKQAADLKVPDEEVNTTFDKLKKNVGSEEELKAQLAKSGMTEEAVKDDIRNSLREQHWLDAQTKDGQPTTDADAEEFYKKNPAQFEKPEEVRASHILVKVAPDAKPEEVIEKEKKAKGILGRIKAGEDFGKLATELSDDPSAKENGGDLNFFRKEQMVPEFAQAAFGMKKGEVSEPVRSQFGYHIIKLTDRKGGDKMSLEEVKPKLIAYLDRQRKEEEVGKVIRGLREKADVKINLPEPPSSAAPQALPR